MPLPPVPHRPPLFCQGRRGTTAGDARPLDAPAAAAQTGEPGVVSHPRRTPAPSPRSAASAPGSGEIDKSTAPQAQHARRKAGTARTASLPHCLPAVRGRSPGGNVPRRKTGRPAQKSRCSNSLAFVPRPRDSAPSAASPPCAGRGTETARDLGPQRAPPAHTIREQTSCAYSAGSSRGRSASRRACP